MKMKKILAGILLILAGYALGVMSPQNRLFPIHQIKKIFHQDKIAANATKPEEQHEEKAMTLEDFNNQDYTVIFTFGQSNSANYGQTKYDCQEEVYNWYDGQIYKARDPLKGASADNGSVWTRLADQLINRGIAKKIIIVPLGIGSTTVSQWSSQGEHHHLITKTLMDLKARDIQIDYILWHQGESDNLFNTAYDSYILDFEDIRNTFRNNGVHAPILMAIATYHPNENALKNKQLGCDEIIQKAQKKLIEKYSDVYAGANTDLLDNCYDRHDGVHFSVLGLEKHAELWLESLKALGLTGSPAQ
ncbi:MAG: hypothetical protein JXQ65_06665 [Candidatus Marinimicrobia bacterium]|nr:hypothetical protein [Candidatus Neomarinimicrobiota bacterium]